MPMIVRGRSDETSHNACSIEGRDRSHRPVTVCSDSALAVRCIIQRNESTNHAGESPLPAGI